MSFVAPHPHLFVIKFNPCFVLHLTDRSSKKNSDRFRRGKIDPDAAQITDVNNYRYVMFL